MTLEFRKPKTSPRELTQEAEDDQSKYLTVKRLDLRLADKNCMMVILNDVTDQYLSHKLREQSAKTNVHKHVLQQMERHILWPLSVSYSAIKKVIYSPYLDERLVD